MAGKDFRRQDAIGKRVFAAQVNTMKRAARIKAAKKAAEKSSAVKVEAKAKF